jgi:hypothetical protein
MGEICSLAFRQKLIFYVCEMRMLKRKFGWRERSNRMEKTEQSAP